MFMNDDISPKEKYLSIWTDFLNFNKPFMPHFVFNLGFFWTYWMIVKYDKMLLLK